MDTTKLDAAIENLKKAVAQLEAAASYCEAPEPKAPTTLANESSLPVVPVDEDIEVPPPAA